MAEVTFAGLRFRQEWRRVVCVDDDVYDKVSEWYAVEAIADALMRPGVRCVKEARWVSDPQRVDV